MAESAERSGFKRVMFELGDEMFGSSRVGAGPDVVRNVAQQIAEVSRKGVEVRIVIGDGSFSHGTQLQQRGMDRTRSDYMGILDAVVSCLVLQGFLGQENVDYHVQTAINMAQVSEPYLPLHAKCHLEKSRVVISDAGMGMPYFSIDTTAAQRALEIDCKVLLTTKTANGVYSANPCRVPDAGLFDDTTHREVLERGLHVTNATAFSLYMDNDTPILMFNLFTGGNITHMAAGKQIGTLVHSW